MDETAVSVRGGRHYLYRAVDRHGKSVDSLLCRDRTVESAEAFFRRAVTTDGCSWPTKINLDGSAASHRALRELRKEDARWGTVLVRARRYLNNVVEQDHRAIKQRCAPMLGLKSFRTVAITLAGVELAHRIRKGQFSVPANQTGRRASLRQLWDHALHVQAVPGEQAIGSFPSMHQISHRRRTAHRAYARHQYVRYPRKYFWGRGLNLQIMPRGGRYWRYKYRYNGKQKTRALGVLPDVSLEWARARHQVARQLLAAGIDPANRKEEVRQVVLALQSAA